MTCLLLKVYFTLHSTVFYFTMQDVFVQLFYNRIVLWLYFMFLGNNDIFISR